MDKARFTKQILKNLTTDQKALFEMISVEMQKETFVFRMPVGWVALNSIWEVIEAVAKEHNIKVKQAGQYATLEELDDLLGDIKWLWNKWIPMGFVTMVAGDPGIGKSAIVQWLVKVVTEGLPFPLEMAPQPKLGTAIWVDTEASQQLIKARATSMKMDKKRIFLPVIMGDILSQANLGFEQDRKIIIDLVEGTNADLLVLDSLGGSHAKGENKVEDIRPVLEFLALLARDKQMAIIVVHHLNKGHSDESPEVSLYRLRGSTIIPAMCRSIFAVEKSYDGNNRIRMIKNNFVRAPDPITVVPIMDAAEDILGFDFKSYIPPPSKKNKKEICAEWVYEQLSKSKNGVSPSTLVEWAEGMYNRQMIYSAREILGDRVTQGGTGRDALWMITLKDNTSINKIISSSNGNNSRVGNKAKKSGVGVKNDKRKKVR